MDSEWSDENQDWIQDLFIEEKKGGGRFIAKVFDTGKGRDY